MDPRVPNLQQTKQNKTKQKTVAGRGRLSFFFPSSSGIKAAKELLANNSVVYIQRVRTSGH